MEREPVPEEGALQEEAPAPLELYVAWTLAVAWALSLVLAGLGAA